MRARREAVRRAEPERGLAAGFLAAGFLPVDFLAALLLAADFGLVAGLEPTAERGPFAAGERFGLADLAVVEPALADLPAPDLVDALRFEDAPARDPADVRPSSAIDTALTIAVWPRFVLRAQA